MVVPWVLLGLAVLALASAIRPGWVRIFLPTPSRIPGAPVRAVPTWEVRAVSLGVLGTVATIAARTLWPIDAHRDLVGFGSVLVVGIALSIWILASIVAHHDNASRALAIARAEVAGGSTDPEMTRLHRRGAAADYRFEYTSLFVTVLAVLISGLAFAITLSSDDTGDTGADAGAAPTQTTNPTDEVLRRFNVLLLPYDVLDAAPETGTVVNARRYALVDADADMPYVIWHQSSQPEGFAPSAALDGVDLVVQTVGFSCTPVALVVVETETTVSVGIAVTEVAASPTPAPTPTIGPDGIPTPVASPGPARPLNCVSVIAPKYHWFPVVLSAPLGDRDVLDADGRSMLEYRPPADY